MNGLNRLLIVLHFLGLAMGFSVAFGNIVMARLIAAAPPSEKPVLGRFGPAITRVGDVGIALLWVTGLTLVYTRWNGFDFMPWQFHAKLAAVVVLTVSIGYGHVLMRQARQGDASAAARLPLVGKLNMTMALLAVVFAVWSFS